MSGEAQSGTSVQSRTGEQRASVMSEEWTRLVLARAHGAWRTWWFEPQETSTLGVIRILFGLVVLAWTLSLLPDLRTFFAPEGILPASFGTRGGGVWTPVPYTGSYSLVLLTFVLTALGALCVTLGIGTRLGCLVVWLGLMFFTRRNTWIMNSGDRYVRVIAFYLILTPAEASLSLRRWLRGRERFWEFPRRSLWGVRLIQIQVSLVYLTAVWDKVRTGPLWNNGTAVSYVWRLTDLRRFSMPTFQTNSLDINLATYGTLAVELSLGVLIWNRRLRPYVIVAGILLHLGIEYSLRVGYFSMISIVAILAFVSPAATTRATRWVRERLGAGRRERLSAESGVARS